MLIKCPKCTHTVNVDALKCPGCGADDPKRRLYRAFKILDRWTFKGLFVCLAAVFLPLGVISHSTAIQVLLSVVMLNLIFRTLKREKAYSLWVDSCYRLNARLTSTQDAA
jgi:hypothetical protein